MANPFHKFPSGRGASSSISSFETGCMNRTLRACRQMLPSGLERGEPYFKSPLIGHPILPADNESDDDVRFLNRLRANSNSPNDRSTGNARSLSCCSALLCRMHNFCSAFHYVQENVPVHLPVLAEHFHNRPISLFTSLVRNISLSLVNALLVLAK